MRTETGRVFPRDCGIELRNLMWRFPPHSRRLRVRRHAGGGIFEFLDRPADSQWRRWRIRRRVGKSGFASPVLPGHLCSVILAGESEGPWRQIDGLGLLPKIGFILACKLAKRRIEVFLV